MKNSLVISTIPNCYFYRIRSGELPDLTNFQCIYRPICVIYTNHTYLSLTKYNNAYTQYIIFNFPGYCSGDIPGNYTRACPRLTKISTMNSHFIVFLARLYYIKIIYVYTLWYPGRLFCPRKRSDIYRKIIYYYILQIIVMYDISTRTNFRWKIHWWYRQYPIVTFTGYGAENYRI